MRLALLALGITFGIIGAVLTIVPRLVDDRAIERHLVAGIEAAVGRPIEIRGPVDLRLWPQPRLTLRKIGLERREVGDEALGVEIEQLEMDLGITGLLLGEVRVHEARIIRPVIELGGVAGEIHRLEAAVSGLAKLDPGVATVSITDAEILWKHDRVSEPVRIRGLDLELVSAQGNNTIGLGGKGRLGDDDLQVEIETRRTSGAAPVKLVLVLGSGPKATRVAYRGTLTNVGALDGTLELAGTSERLRDQLAGLGYLEAIGPAAPDLNFALKSKIKHHEATLELADLRIATDGGELEGRLDWQGGATPNLDLALEAGKLTLAEPIEHRHLGLLREPWAGGTAAKISLKIGALVHGGEQLRLLRLEASAQPTGEIAIERLTADLPGTGDIEITGNLAPDALGSTWTGRIVGAVQEPAPLRRWLALGQEHAWLDRRRGVALDSRFSFGPDGLALEIAELRIDATRASGKLDYTSVPRPRLKVTGKVERLVLEHLLDEGRAGLADLQSRLQQDDLSVALDLELQRLAWHDLRLEGVSLVAEADAERLRIDRLTANENGGATLGLTGLLPWNQRGPVTLDLEADAASLSRLARFWPTGLPLTLPADGEAKLRAKLRGTAEGAAMDASLTAPQLDLRVSGRIALEEGLVPLDLAGEMTVPSLVGLSPQLALGNPGPDRLQGTTRIKRQASSSYGLGAELAIGSARHQAELEIVTAGARPRIDGKARLEPLTAQAIAQLYRLLEAPLGLPPGPIAGWPGNWPGTTLALEPLARADIDILLSATLENAGRRLGDARARLALQSGRLLVDGIELPLAGGTLGGELILDPNFGVPVAGLTLRMDDVDPSLLLRDALGEEVEEQLAFGPAGAIDATLIADSVGYSLPEILGNLEGRIDIAGIVAPWQIRRGVARIDPPLRWEQDGRAQELRGFLDPAAWLMELQLDRPTTGGEAPLRFLGTPERLRRIETTAATAPR